MPTRDEILETLEKCLELVDFDGARAFLDGLNWDLPIGEDYASLRISSIAADVADYFGMYRKAKVDVLEKIGCEKMVLGLSHAAATNDEDRKLLKQKVWLVSHWGMIQYRADKQVEAQSLFNLCGEVVSSRLIRENDHSYGTRARIAYVTALVFRQCYCYSEAKAKFTESVALSWQHLEEKRDLSENEYNRTKLFTDFQVSKCLALGLGWICYEEGLPYLARPFIAAARVLLAGTRANIIKSYVDLVHAASLRASLGDNPEHLLEAEEVLRRSHDAFEIYKHDGYQLRAASELAILYLQKGELAKADHRLKKVTGLATLAQDHRWLCNASVLESRWNRLHSEEKQRAAAPLRDQQGGLEPEDPKFRKLQSQIDDLEKQASEYAKNSLKAANVALGEIGKMEALSTTFSHVDVLIVRGEASLLLGDFDEARRNFEEAKEKGGTNDKIRAVCELHLARVCIQEKNKSDALYHFGQWKLLSTKVENAWIRRFSATIEGEIKALKDFAIPWSSKEIDRKSVEADFHYFLASWAVEKCGSQEKAADEFGVTSQTIRKWLRKAQPKVKKKPE